MRQDYEQAINCVREEKFHKALNHLHGLEDMSLYAEIERLAYLKDAVSNYSDRIMDELAKKHDEVEKE